jgi:hypothetical protein
VRDSSSLLDGIAREFTAMLPAGITPPEMCSAVSENL